MSLDSYTLRYVNVYQNSGLPVICAPLFNGWRTSGEVVVAVIVVVDRVASTRRLEAYALLNLLPPPSPPPIHFAFIAVLRYYLSRYLVTAIVENLRNPRMIVKENVYKPVLFRPTLDFAACA
jgi:hypothetical protein